MSESLPEHGILFSIFLIFTGAAVLATLALMARQALIIAYILLGVALGPHGFSFVNDPDLIADMSEVGIIFLLFLLGLNLVPVKLVSMFREATLVALLSALVFMALGFSIAWLFRFTFVECILIGFVSSFSSTIIGLKLLPTTVLHHRHTGEMIISVLLLQDLIAIVGLLMMKTSGSGIGTAMLALFIKLPALIGCAVLLEKYLLTPLFNKYDRIQEYVFLVTIGWCIGFAQAAASLGLSYEIGAFVAGVALAANPVSLFIADALRHVRDFFLVIFFFAIGAKMDLIAAQSIVFPALALAGLMLIIKPMVFSRLFRWTDESPSVAAEAGARLGQMSEFSLLMIFMAGQAGLAGMAAQSLVQLATILTFIGSTIWIVMKYPSPIAVSDALRRD